LQSNQSVYVLKSKRRKITHCSGVVINHGSSGALSALNSSM